MITYIDSIHSQISKDQIKELRDALAYESVFYRQGAFSKSRHASQSYLLNLRSGIFLSGLTLRIQKYAQKKKINLVIDQYKKEEILPEQEPKINGIIFRDDQIDLIQKALKYQRGVIHAPTGVGKTVIAAGIASCFKSKNILFLCHTKSIIDQSCKRFEEYGFKNISKIHGESKSDLNQITFATIQSFVKLNPDIYSTFFDIVLVDECHHIAAPKGKDRVPSQYGKVFEELLAPIKIGFTATLPKIKNDKKKLFTIEGYLGPVIGKITINECKEIGILAKPIIKLIPVPENNNIRQIRSYKDIYKKAIIESNIRNLLIVNEVEKRADKTILIMVKEIEHGNQLLKLLKQVKIKSEFVRGSTESENREKIKNLLNRKKIKCVIATAVWREGIDIPSLDCVINACGGRSETMTLQSIGRGLRKTNEKSEVEIIDFLDPYKYLAEHAIQRISIYSKNNWI